MEDFEIATFEFSDLYDGVSRVPADEVVDKFMQQYIRYLNPEYYAEEDIWFSRSRLWFSCRDKSGGDKPMTIMLIGPITDAIITEIKESVAKLHIKKCEDCGKEMSKVESKKWDICLICREL
jgi:translation initiation factor 2 beta subunit (eIF-2beta)/eIF-5